LLPSQAQEIYKEAGWGLSKLGKYPADIAQNASKYNSTRRQLGAASAHLAQHRSLTGRRYGAMLQQGLAPPHAVRARERDLTNKFLEARQKAWAARFGIAKTGAGYIKDVSAKAFGIDTTKDAEKRTDITFNAAFSAFNEFIGLAEAGVKYHTLGAQRSLFGATSGARSVRAQSSIGGLKLSRPASTRVMRGLIALDAAEAGFQAGFKGGQAVITLYLSAVAPDVANEFEKAAKTFEANGGFNLSLLGGALAGFGASDEVMFGLQNISDRDFGVDVKEALGLPDLSEAVVNDNLELYYRGLSAP
jgi:hypothetical protein